MRRIVSVGIFTVLLLWIVSVQANQNGVPQFAATGGYRVTTTTDSSDGSCDSHCSLREAIIAANNDTGMNPIVYIPNGTYTLTIVGADEDAALQGDLDVTRFMTIIGEGRDTTIIDGNDLDRVFDVHGDFMWNNTSYYFGTPQFMLSDVTVQNGFVSGASGGGIRIISPSTIVPDITLMDVTIQNSQADDGGGLTVKNVILRSHRLRLINNTATNRGGGLFVDASDTPHVANYFYHSVIRMNTAIYGGGIYLLSNSSSSAFADYTSLLHTELINNTAQDGGGLYAAGTLYYERYYFTGTISGNQATNNGGGVYNQNVPVYIYNTTVSNNSADSDNNGSGDGGGLYGGTNATEFDTSIVYGNIDTGGQAPECAPSGAVTATTDSIIGNFAPCSNTAGTGTVTGQDPLLLPLADNGGDTYTHALQAGSPAIGMLSGDNCYIHAIDQRIVPYRMFGTTCEPGAYAYVNGVPAAEIPPVPTINFQLPGTTVERERLEKISILFNEPMHDVQHSTTDSAEVDNPANYRVLAPGSDGTFQTTTCDAVQGDDTTVPHHVFRERMLFETESNPAIDTMISIMGMDNAPLAPGTYRIFICDEITDIDGNAVDGNLDMLPGGDARFDIEVMPSNLTLFVTTAVDTTDGTCDSHCSLRDAVRVANGNTGQFTIIYVPAGTYTLTLTGTSESNALTGDLDIRQGMAIIGAGRDATIINGNGTDRIFDIINVTNFVIDSVTLENGVTTGTGGAVNGLGYNNGIVRSRLRDNTAASGGGLYVVSNNPYQPFVYSSEFTGNNATSNGGAIYGIKSFEVHTSAFYNNSAVRGSAIASTSPFLTIYNSTISSNIGTGGAIFYTEQLVMYQTTIASNESGVLGDNESAIHASSSIFANNGTLNCGTHPDYTFAGYYPTGSYNIFGDAGCPLGERNLYNTDPLLEPLADNGGLTQTHALAINSPAQDVFMSHKCVEAIDQRGAYRQTDGLCNVGAYENDTFPALNVPTGLTTTSVLDTTLTLQWDDTNTTESGYSVERSADDGSTWTQIAQLGTDTTTYGDSGLSCLTVYQYRVYAYRTIDNAVSGDSNTLGVSTVPCLQTAPYTVNTTIDENDGYCGVEHCSLREAVNAAHSVSGALINMPIGTYSLTDYLTISNGMTIIGAGAGQTIVDMGGVTHFSEVNFDLSGQTFELQHITFRNGTGVPTNARAVIFDYHPTTQPGNLRLSHSEVLDSTGNTIVVEAREFGQFYIEHSFISGNSSERGIISSSQSGADTENNNVKFYISDSVFTDNGNTDPIGASIATMNGNRNGLLIERSAFAENGFGTYQRPLIEWSGSNPLFFRIENSTFSGNAGSFNHASILDVAGTGITLDITHVTMLNDHESATAAWELSPGSQGMIVNVNNSILIGNSTSDFCDENGNIFSDYSENNLTLNAYCSFLFGFDDDPMLLPLGDYGGDTLTHALAAGSAAIDAASCGFETDQRGFPRPDSDSEYCDIGAFEGVVALLDTPEIIDTTEVSTEVISFYWSEIVEATEYRVERSEDGGDTWIEIAVIPAGQLNYSDDTVACDGNYRYRVRAYNDVDEMFSLYSNELAVELPVCNLQPPASLTVSESNMLSLVLSWSNVAGETGFILERYNPIDELWHEIATTGQDVTTYTDENLGCNENYSYRVAATDGERVSEYSIVAVGSTLACPILTAPVLTTVQATSRNSIGIVWTDPNSVEDKYIVEHSDDSGNTWHIVRTVVANSTTYSDVVYCNTTYRYRVRGYDLDTDTYSAYSNIGTATTSACLTLTVNVTADEFDFTCDVAHCSLRDAIDDAKTGDTVYLPAGTYTLNNTPTLYHPITILGDGMNQSIIDRQQGGSIFQFSNSIPNPSFRMTVDGVDLTNAYVELNGRAVFAGYHPNLTNLTIRNSEISGNEGDFGIILLSYFNTSTTFTLDNVVVRDNTVGRSLIWDAGEDTDPHSIIIRNSLFTNNQLANEEPAAHGVLLDTTGNAQVLIENSAFVSNGTTHHSNIFLGGSGPSTYNIRNSTISGNGSDSTRSVIYLNADEFDLIFEHVTMTNNYGYIFLLPPTTTSDGLRLKNSIVANNITTSPVLSCWLDGVMMLEGYNVVTDTEDCAIVQNTPSLPEFINIDPLLLSLADNGGDTLTHALQTGSPAVNAIPIADCILSTDQRGVARPIESACDIGAYEGSVDVLPTPQNFAITSVTGTTVSLAWDDIEGETAYQLQRSNDAGASWLDINFGANTTSHTDASGLPCDTTFQYRLRAYDETALLYSNYTATLEVMTTPCSPTSLAVVTFTHNSVDMQWVDNTSTETDYRVERSADGGMTWTEIDQLMANSIYHVDDSAACDATYHYQVRAYRSTDGLYSEYSESVSVTTELCPLIAPTGLTTSNITDTSITLQWNDNDTTETGYRVERSDDGGNSWLEIAMLSANSTSYPDTGLTCDTSYQYQVRAYRDVDSTYSEYSDILPTATTPCLQTGPIFTVTTTDGASGGIGGACYVNACNLGAAIYAARSVEGGVAYAPAGTYLFYAPMVIDDDVNILGDGAGQTIFDAQGITHLFESDSNAVEGYEIVIDGVTLTNAYSADHSAILYDAPYRRVGSFTLRNGEISDSVGKSLIVYISLQSTFSITLENTLVTRNMGDRSGYIELLGNGVRQVTIRGSVFIDNDKDTMLGTLLLAVASNEHQILIEDSAFLRNGQTNGSSLFSITGASATPITISNSTFSENVSITTAPSVADISGAVSLILNHVTITDNIGTPVYHNPGGGLQYQLTAFGNIISGNDGEYDLDCRNFQSQGYNILGNLNLSCVAGALDVLTNDPLLMPVAENGGNTWTNAVQIGSPAIDAIPAGSCTEELDQRGISRPQATGCDSGAYEATEAYLALPAPTNMNATAVSYQAIDLLWEDNATNESNYVVERSLDGSIWTALTPLGANAVEYTDSGLDCDTTYQYQVRAYRSADDRYSGYTSIASATTAPCMPVPVVGTVTLNSVEWSWNDVLTETEYRFERSDDNEQTWLEIAQPDQNVITYTDNTVVCEMNYVYRLRAYRSTDGLYSEYSDPIPFAMPLCPLTAPAELSVTATSATTIDLQWSESNSSETAILLERSDDGITWVQIAELAPDTTIYQDTALTCETIYDYRVRAYRADDDTLSEASNIINPITAICAIPNPPTDLQVTAINARSVDLTWADNDTSVTQYTVERSRNNGASWQAYLVPDNDGTTFTAFNLTCQTDWQFRVRGRRLLDNRTTAYSNTITIQTLPCPPLVTPNAPVVTAFDTISVSLSFTPDATGEVTQWQLERLANGSWQSIATLPARTTQYTDSNLSCSTAYSYRLRSHRAEDGAVSVLSAETPSTTLDCPIPFESTVGLYRNGLWLFTDTNATNTPDIQIRFGPQEAGWMPIVGDWNGDGIDGIGVYRNGLFLLRNTTDSGVYDTVFYFGLREAGWMPIVGDWNGDGLDTVGVYKAGQFMLTNNHDTRTLDHRFIWNVTGQNWIAIAGDWDENGADSVGLYQTGTFILNNALNNTMPIRFTFGPTQPGWYPVAGDWNTDGVDSIGIYNQSIWRLRNSNTAGTVDTGFNFGAQETGWIPIASYRGGAAPLLALAQAANFSFEPTVEPTIAPTEPPIVEITPQVTGEVTEITVTDEAVSTPEATTEPTETTVTSETVTPTEAMIFPTETSVTVEPTAPPIEPTAPLPTETPLPEPTDIPSEVTQEVSPP